MNGVNKATPFVLGLTGGLGMGKSWAAMAFTLFGVPVFDSDKAVHGLLGPGGGAAKEVAAMFPKAITKGLVDRKKLGDIVFNNSEQLSDLEAILHPMIEHLQKKFIAFHARRRTRLVVLDAPLLFETGADLKTDLVACVYAPSFVQRPRVLVRPGMSRARMQAVENNQFSPELKCQLADIIISTRAGRSESLHQVGQLVKVLRTQPGKVWSPHWGR